MVDYFSLLGRAVATLNPNTREQRHVLYNRARKMLTDKLGSGDPALANTDWRAEIAALEAAIQRVETDSLRRATQSPRAPAYEAAQVPSEGYRDRPPLKDARKPLRIVAGLVVVLLFVLAGVAAYSFWPRILSEARNIPASRSAPVAAEQPDVKSEYVRLRQLVYYRTNQPVGTIVVDKSQTFLYVVRPNVSALRYSIGVGKECTSLAGLYHVVRKETAANGDDGTKNLLGARVLYLDKEYRIHGSNASNVNVQQLPNGCIRLVNDDVIYLYDRTPLESRVVVSN